MELDPSKLKLWKHQRTAVATCGHYFESDSLKSCLVHMPTGTGKTGVMAVLASRRSVESPVMVVCPSAALVEQLMKELSNDFWARIGAPDEWRPDHVYQALPGSIDALAAKLAAPDRGRVVVVSTIQAVQQVYADDAIGKLSGKIGTILFDEGHREPAPIWAKVVRGFGVPTVLFSATPFRGDLKVFNVDDDHMHFLSFDEAVDQALIRGVKVEERHLAQDTLLFAVQVVEERDRLIRDGIFDQDCKVIVRAASESTVSDLFDAFVVALEGRDEGVLAMHNNFADSGDPGALRRGSVPSLKGRNEHFLIHQFMLVEGIDDPACTILAMFEPFTSTRMLVQQIGRLTRQPAGAIGRQAERARVLARTGDGVDAQWKSFLRYDQACIKNGGKPPIRNGQEVLGKIVEVLPEFDYIGGKFRERLNLENSDLSPDLRFPRSALVYEVDPAFDLDNFASDVSALLEEEDRYQHQLGGVPGKACRYHVSLSLTQTPFLAESLFQTASLDVTIYSVSGPRLFFYDSAGLWIDDLEHVGARVSPLNLQSLLPEQSSNAISFLAVKNTDLGPLALRGRTLSARSLARSGAFMGEHMNVVTRATGWVEKTRRAVGFSRGRVRDGDGYEVSASEFAEWCDQIDQELELRPAAASLFKRFAIPAAIPADTTPVNILIDMQELTEQFSVGGKDATIDPDGLCVDVVPDPTPKAPGPYRFEVTIDGKVHAVWIRWDRKKRKYWLTSSTLSQVKANNDEKASLTKRLNQLQAFRIITADHRHAYVDGDFYSLDLDLSDPNGAARLVLDLVTAVDELGALTSEKGTPGGERLATWREGSLFRFVDDQVVDGRGTTAFGTTFPAVVCDDLGTEAGDFIGVDGTSERPRVAFLVCKHKGGDAGVSTSAFYDVSGQGLKNLAYLKSDGTDLAGSPRKFDNDWVLTADKLTDHVPRRRAGPGSQAFRSMLSKAKRNPGAERAIWLVCAGGMLSRSKLQEAFKEKPPRAHVLQFYHLVVSAFSACQSVGVQLKIFCSK